LSLRSAYRWLARWHGLTAHVRTRLHMVATPPGKAGGPPDLLSLGHLAAAFRNAACPIAAFQLHFQLPVTG